MREERKSKRRGREKEEEITRDDKEKMEYKDRE